MQSSNDEYNSDRESSFYTYMLGVTYFTNTVVGFRLISYMGGFVTSKEFYNSNL